MVLRNYNLRMIFPLIADVAVCGVPIQILEVMLHWGRKRSCFIDSLFFTNTNISLSHHVTLGARGGTFG